jgi:hypothetical protein
MCFSQKNKIFFLIFRFLFLLFYFNFQSYCNIFSLSLSLSLSHVIKILLFSHVEMMEERVEGLKNV